MPLPAATAPTTVPREGPELTERYAAYRRRQAERLIRLMPREAVRPLYRKAAARAAQAGEDPGGDPMAVLVRYCETLLPLPPFETWRDDLARHPAAYLADLSEDGAGAPSAAAPSPLDARMVEFAGDVWRATLRTFRDGSVWRGFIAFEGTGHRAVHRTAAVFCEPDPTALHARFRSFDPPALQAFLRSTLP